MCVPAREREGKEGRERKEGLEGLEGLEGRGCVASKRADTVKSTKHRRRKMYGNSFEASDLQYNEGHITCA